MADKPLTPEEIEEAANDLYALGYKDREGKSLFRAQVDLRGHAIASVKVYVWAETEDQAKEMAEEWACENTLDVDHVDWDVDSSTVQILLDARDPETLTRNRAYAEPRGQTFLV